MDIQMTKKQKRLFVILIFFILLVSFNGYSQEKPSIAIIPLNYINVSKDDAQVLTSLLETALVNTDTFNVLAQTQIAEILKAQEYSLNDYTDEKSAIEFGKLLAAGQIVLGSVSKIGAKYIVTAKIIDVETSKTVKADKVEANSLEKLSDQMDLLGFKLAGLTFKKGGTEKVAKAFGKMFVQTEPSGAKVYLNGVKKGTSPLLLNKVPLGKVFIEVRKENMYAHKDVRLTEEKLTEVILKLKMSTGNFFIKTDKTGLKVYLDSKYLGDLGSGLFKNITSGEYNTELKGNGYYWKGSINVKSGKTVMVEVYPIEVGSIKYVIPEGASAEISGINFRKVVYGSGKIDTVRTGSYMVKVTGNKYKVYKGKINISKGTISSFSPILEYKEAYKSALRKKKEKQESERKIKELVQFKVQLQLRYNKALIERNKRNIWGWVTLGTGVIAIATTGSLIYLGKEAYANYKVAKTTKVAVNYRNESLLYNGLAIDGGITVSITFLLSTILWELEPKPTLIEAEIKNVNTKLIKLKESLR